MEEKVRHEFKVKKLITTKKSLTSGKNVCSAVCGEQNTNLLDAKHVNVDRYHHFTRPYYQLEYNNNAQQAQLFQKLEYLWFHFGLYMNSYRERGQPR